MTLPLIGTFEGTVVGSAPASIHGDVYHDVLLIPSAIAVPADEESIRRAAVHARIPSHLCPQPPRPGAVVRLTMLMGQVAAADWGS